MASPYKRRKPSLIRNLWVYRRLVLAAVVLGLLLSFIVINNQPVTIYFPFRLGQISSTAGLILLLGAASGALITALVGTLFFAWRYYKGARSGPGGDEGGSSLPDDRPPTDYAAKTTEGFSDAPWSRE
jgi:uncharacterized integral membrane protein